MSWFSYRFYANFATELRLERKLFKLLQDLQLKLPRILHLAKSLEVTLATLAMLVTRLPSLLAIQLHQAMRNQHSPLQLVAPQTRLVHRLEATQRNRQLTHLLGAYWTRPK
jgi:hypothetical protein